MRFNQGENMIRLVLGFCMIVLQPSNVFATGCYNQLSVEEFYKLPSGYIFTAKVLTSDQQKHDSFTRAKHTLEVIDVYKGDVSKEMTIILQRSNSQ